MPPSQDGCVSTNFGTFRVSAGVFVFAKLGRDSTTWDEEALLVKLCKEAGVVVSAGRTHHGIESEKSSINFCSRTGSVAGGFDPPVEGIRSIAPTRNS